MKNVEINEVGYPSIIESFIDNYIKDNSLENVKVISRPAVAKGNNFMGIIHRITVVSDHSGRNIENNFILKTPVSDEALRNVFSQRLLFEREIYIYKEVAKLYDELQTKLPDAEKFTFPKCLFSSSAKFEQCVLLEDLQQEGFTSYNRLKSVDFEHASLAMEALGKMHAMSFYVQENMKEEFRHFKEILDDVAVATFCPDGKSSSDITIYEVRFEELSNVLDCEEYKRKLKEFALNIYDHMTAISLPGPYTVIAHGDFWISNMLFKYEDDKPVDVRVLDYQMSRFASPILDLGYFIACSMDGEFRKLYYDDILEVYYNSLSGHLSHFSVKVSDVYPRRVFYEQLKKYFAFGIGYTIINLPNSTRDEADAVDVTETMNDYVNDGVNKSKSKHSELYRVRGNELVRDCISYGYL